ncbi:hypothetical protein [Lysobacter gummosus]|uniref:hypothetical protein n=1 Tax=Lysobacter gummosus TaxID=262324 RepID=UPI00364549FF
MLVFTLIAEVVPRCLRTRYEATQACKRIEAHPVGRDVQWMRGIPRTARVNHRASFPIRRQIER